MKRNRVVLLLASISAAAMIAMSGCGGIDLTTIGTEETTLSAEMESEDLAEGTCDLHTIWYGSDNSILSNASVVFTQDGTEIFSGVTGEDGSLDGVTIPANTAVVCTVSDSSGSEIAKGTIVCKLSAAYTDITIYPVHLSDEEETEKELVVEVPLSKISMRMAIFTTEDGHLSIANASPYIAPADATEGEASEEGTAEGESTDGSTEETSEADASTEGETSEESADTASTEGEASADQADSSASGEAAAE